MPSAAQVDGIGVCTNGECTQARRGQPIERYPGPGQYCPECGELLISAAVQPGVTPDPQAAPDPETTTGSEGQPEHGPPLEREAVSEQDPHPTGVPPDPARRRVFIAGSAIALVALAAVAIGLTQLVPALRVSVCASTMTDGIAKKIVGAYSSQHPVWPYHYAVTTPGDFACDVRFFTAAAGHNESVIAHDGVVAVVNPQNSIGQLDKEQVRDIFAGRITDWSEVGGHRGPIAAAVPGEGSDEVHALEDRLMSGRPLGSRVGRTLTAAQIVRWVASPSGASSIGVVPFSAALPAKVVTLKGPPAPSSLSIGDERYPLSLRILAGSDFRHPSEPAAELLTFAHSAAVRSLLLRAALATPSGS